jgi:sensitive to high expression protein 9
MVRQGVLLARVLTRANLTQIRSLSTYGSLAITGVNVLIFLLALLLIEPWRRRKLVERLEIR